jgi:hypothetical protein
MKSGVTVVYMAWDVKILMRANPFRGQLEGVGPENQDFLGPEMAKGEASPFVKSKALYKKQVHW